jgi:hypothetical protein
MEELHVQIIVFDNEYPFGHRQFLAAACDRSKTATDLRRATVKKSITLNAPFRPISYRGKGCIGIFLKEA